MWVRQTAYLRISVAAPADVHATRLQHGFNPTSGKLTAHPATLLSLIAISQDTGVPNTDLPAPVASSTGPQRSVRGAKGKGKQVDKGKVKRKRTSRAAPPPGFDWPTTTDRFCAEMAKIYFNQPTGEVITPETAYASATKFIKEDLYLSVSGFFYCDRDHRLTNSFIWCQPLVTKPLGDRSCRELEQYLTGVLKELRPRAVGEKRGIRYTLERRKQITYLYVTLIPTKPCSYSRRQTRERAGRHERRLRPPGRALERGGPEGAGCLSEGGRTEAQGTGTKGGHP